MRFTETALPGTWIIDLEPVQDERGFFARTWCREEFEQHGLTAEFTQCNISFNPRKATLRGMHYQIAPYEEVKLVRCTAGGIYDVIVDLRPQSPTFKHWLAIELNAGNRKMVYVPQGVAHGFQTLTDSTEVSYQMAGNYRPEYATGVRWDDPALAIAWPYAEPILSERDRSFPLLEMPHVNNLR